MDAGPRRAAFAAWAFVAPLAVAGTALAEEPQRVAAPTQPAPFHDQVIGVWMGGAVTSTLTRSGEQAGGFWEPARVWDDQLLDGVWFAGLMQIRLGGEGGQFAGLATASFDFGLPLLQSHGRALIVGAGLFAETLGSKHLTSSLVDPHAVLGYRYRGRRLLVELLARGGAVPNGWYDPDLALSRDLAGSFDGGAELTLAVPGRILPLLATARWTTFWSPGPLSRVDTLRGMVCSAFVCADVRLYAGDAEPVHKPAGTRGPVGTSAAMVGLSILLPAPLGE